MNAAKISGAVLVVLNLYWIGFYVNLFYKYHYTAILFAFMLPDWLLILNVIFGIVGVYLGCTVYRSFMSIKKGIQLNISCFIFTLLVEFVRFKDLSPKKLYLLA